MKKKEKSVTLAALPMQEMEKKENAGLNCSTTGPIKKKRKTEKKNCCPTGSNKKKILT